MRQRYYNTEIKRFINQDIVVGSISNSQSLNRYSYVQGNPVTLTDPFGLSPSAKDIIMGAIHGLLDVVGCSPEGIGIAANLLNAALYAFVDHDYGMASLSLLAGATLGATKVAAMAGKAAKAAKTVATAGKFISNVASFAICATQAADVGSAMWQKYYVEGKSLDGGSAMEFLALGLNMAGMAMSGKGMVESGNKICKSIKESGVTNKISSKVTGGSVNNASNGKTLITHRGTNESITKKLEQGYLKAYEPRTKLDSIIDHNKKAVWVSEGNPTWFNRIFSGMIGKRGEASITFKVSSNIVKRPSGIKKIFGKVQRVIEQDVSIPEDAIIRMGGRK